MLFQLLPNVGDPVCMYRETRDDAMVAAQVLAERRSCAVRVYLDGPGETTYLGTCEPQLAPARASRMDSPLDASAAEIIAANEAELAAGRRAAIYGDEAGRVYTRCPSCDGVTEHLLGCEYMDAAR